MFSEDKNSACNLPLAERSLYILRCLQRPEDGQSSPVASEHAQEQRGLWGTTEKLPHLKGHQLPAPVGCCQAGRGPRVTKLCFCFCFPQGRPKTGFFFFVVVVICFFNRKRLDL